MDVLWYCAPSGERLLNPSADQMHEQMALDYDEHWGPYSPVGILDWYEDQVHTPLELCSGIPNGTLISQLLFIRHPERGWFFEYGTRHAPREWLVSRMPSNENDSWVQHWANGEEVYLLSSCFVNSTIGKQVVADFLVTKKPSISIEWEDFNRRSPRRNERPAQKRRQDRN